MAPNLEQMAKTGAEGLLHRREDIVGDVFLGFVNVVDLEIWQVLKNVTLKCFNAATKLKEICFVKIFRVKDVSKSFLLNMFEPKIKTTWA